MLPHHDNVVENDDSRDIQLKPHYVYVLIDPRTEEEEVFYVGKGQNGRLKDHERSADNHIAASTAKNERIQQIHAAGLRVKGLVVGRFDTEAEAYAVEAVLIHWMYGRCHVQEEGGPLTNLQAGHNHRHIRRRSQLEEAANLDLAARIVLEPGQYSREALARLERNRVPEIALDALERVRAGLEQRGVTLEFDAPRIVEAGRYVASDATLCDGVVVRLQFTPKQLVTNLRAANEGTREGRRIFTQALEALQAQVAGLEIKHGGHYGWLPGWNNNPLQFFDTEAILDRLAAAKNLFAPQ